MVSGAVQQSLAGPPPAAADLTRVTRWFGGFYSFAFYARSAGRGRRFTTRGAG